MRVSRWVVGLLVAVGVGTLAGGSGCSSGSTSGFGDLGTGPDGSVRGTIGPDGAIIGTDSPTTLNMGHDSGVEAAVSHEAGFRDARVAVDGTKCVEDAGPAGPGPVQHTCVIYPVGADDGDECDGHHDLPGFAPNGSTGNGFDDNCNGLVDEGCACENVGTTKPCYLVPASQTLNGLPVGWCATNSKGTVNCAQKGEGVPQWSGTCRGAEPPYANDVCAPGDFNCDGKEENPTGESCGCKSSAITCPSAPVTTVPYPPPNALPLEVNAAAWFADPAQVANATAWYWTLTGGDCDNILPYPTFGMYTTPNGTGTPLGALSTSLGASMKEHGIALSQPGVTSVIYPAFSLSGDYVLTGAWELNGQKYSCTLQIQVRAPGLRAEGCWDTEAVGDDVDLHMAKVDGFSQCATSHAWSDLACANANEDCYYEDCYSGGFGSVDSVNWGYPTTPLSNCSGWGSQTTGASACGNPRLDRDANGLSGTCDPSVFNPNGSSITGPFCGPENINVDAPGNNDVFAIGLRFYNQSGSTPAKSHVNVYCDGARILAAGYDPVAGNLYPQLATPGQDSTGDMWKVALVTTTVSGGVLTCNVVPTQSKVANAALDGSTAYCVDDASLNGAESQEHLTAGGGVPANANALCYH